MQVPKIHGESPEGPTQTKKETKKVPGEADKKVGARGLEEGVSVTEKEQLY